MITPRWLETRSQPIAIRDVVRTLAALAIRDEAPDEVHLGGADVLTYREMLRPRRPRAGPPPPLLVRVPAVHAAAVVLLGRAGHPRRRSGWCSRWSTACSVEMVVRRPRRPGLNDDPLGFDDAVRAALAA